MKNQKPNSGSFDTYENSVKTSLRAYLLCLKKLKISNIKTQISLCLFCKLAIQI